MENKRILIIDDDPEIWGAYQAVLEAGIKDFSPSGHQMARLIHPDHDSDIWSDCRGGTEFELRFAGQGLEGIERVERALLEEKPFAVAFIDIRMPPGIDGMETAARIRQMDPDIEIVIVTAYSDCSRNEIARKVGSQEKLLFLRKPFDPDELEQIAISLTEKWRLAKQDEARRNELEVLFKTIPAGIFTVDAGGYVTAWNPAAEKITGFASEEVIGKPCIIKQIAANRPCEACCILGVHTCVTGKEFVIFDKQGRRRTLYKSFSCVKGSSGELLKVVESFWDMTERKEAEAALRKSERRYRSLVESLRAWVWEVGADGTFTYCSPICEQIYGYRPEELLGKSVEELVAEQDSDVFRQQFQGCVQEKKGFSNVELRRLNRAGDLIHIESSAEPIIAEDGSLVGFRGIDRDITQRRKNEQERMELLEQHRQSQKMEALGTLAGGIAHDLNNILTPILGHAQLAMMKTDESGPVYRKLEEIMKNAHKASGLIRQILAFSRKQVLKKKPSNINGLIRNMVDLLGRLIPENIDMKVSLDDSLWNTAVDSGQLEQILINLVVNARDAITGNGTIEIQTWNEEVFEEELYDIERRPIVGSFVVLTVKDDGPGVSEKLKNRIFDPFFTTKKDGQGTGLGLSMVYGIVKQHQGYIRLESEPENGAAFHIYLEKSGSVPRSDRDDKSGSVRGGRETILVAEDNPEVREVVNDTLSCFGYRVIEASNGTQALELFEKFYQDVDLVLTDIVMPGFSGFELAQAVHDRIPGVPVILMTGHPLDTAGKDLVDCNYASLIQKPFKPKDMAEKVRKAIDKRRDKQQAVKIDDFIKRQN